MKKLGKLTLALAVMLWAGAAVKAQEKPKEAEAAQADVSARAQIVLTEFDGPTKISSVPYTVKLAIHGRVPPDSERIRIGARIPINVQTKDGAPSIQYQDVGTSLDYSAQRMDDGRYKVRLFFERSSIYVSDSSGKAAEWAPGKEKPGSQPILRQFNGSYVFFARDGQLEEAVVAADPLSGHTLKIEVTIHVEK